MKIKEQNIWIGILIVLLLSLAFSILRIVRINAQIRSKEVQVEVLEVERGKLALKYEADIEALKHPKKVEKPKEKILIKERIVKDYTLLYKLLFAIQGKKCSEIIPTIKKFIEKNKEVTFQLVYEKTTETERDEGSVSEPVFPTFKSMTKLYSWRFGVVADPDTQVIGAELGYRIYKSLELNLEYKSDQSKEIGLSIVR